VNLTKRKKEALCERSISWEGQEPVAIKNAKKLYNEMN